MITRLQAWRLAVAHVLAGLLPPPYSLRRVRAMILRLGGVDIAPGCEISGLVRFAHHNATVRRASFIGPGSLLIPTRGAAITVGERVSIGPRVTIVTISHDIGPADKRAGAPFATPVTIGDGCWIGAGVTVLPGVTIGRGSVIAAGAVVTTDIPTDSFAAGVPAVVRRQL